MGLKICSLSSGSSGNATYIGSDRANILVDAGLPAKYIIKALNDINVSPCELDAILVSHEHTDHIKGIGALSRRFDIPIYANEPTWTSMRSKLGNIKSKNMRIFYTDMDFYIKDINVQAFAIPHDAAKNLSKHTSTFKAEMVCNLAIGERLAVVSCADKDLPYLHCSFTACHKFLLDCLTILMRQHDT